MKRIGNVSPVLEAIAAITQVMQQLSVMGWIFLQIKEHQKYKGEVGVNVEFEIK